MKKIAFIFSSLLPFFAFSQADGDTLFDAPIVHEIYFQFYTPNFIDSLMSSHTTDRNVAAAMTIDGVLLDSIALKYKGNSSFNYPGQKKSMKVDLNDFILGQKYDGLNKFNLNNGFKDPTMLREKIALDFFNEIGVPSPRCSYAKVYFNNDYWGLFTLVEEVNKDFLQQRFAENDSNLYKGDPHGDLRWKGNVVANYYTDYTLETNTTSNDWTGLVHLIDKINNTPNNFHDSLETVLYTPHFLKIWAATNLFANLDSYIGSGHNYFIYQKAYNSKFEFIPWDVNESFGTFSNNLTATQIKNLSLFYTGMAGSRPLIEKMVANSTYKNALADETCFLLQYFFNEDHIFPKIDSLANTIRPFVYADTKKVYTNQQFEDNLTTDLTTSGPGGGNMFGLKSFLTTRHDFIFQELQSYSCHALATQNAITSEMIIYPNPVEDRLYFDTKTPITEVSIWDLAGKMYLQTNEMNNGISVSALSSGIYMAKITDKRGNLEVKKFCKL